MHRTSVMLSATRAEVAAVTKGGKQFLGYTCTLGRVRIGVVAAVAMTAFMLAGCTQDVYDAAGEATPKPSSTQPHVATLGRWIEHPTQFMHCTGVTSGGVIDYAPGRGADTAEGAVRYAFATMYDQVPYHLQKVSSGTLPHGDGFAQYIAFGKD